MLAPLTRAHVEGWLAGTGFAPRWVLPTVAVALDVEVADLERAWLATVGSAAAGR